jgi:hypothetical protein
MNLAMLAVSALPAARNVHKTSEGPALMDSMERENVQNIGRISPQSASLRDVEEFSRRDGDNGSHSSIDPQAADQKPAASQAVSHELDAHFPHHRLIELEIENFRLQRLVAELLIKNQQLRGSFCGDTDVSEASSHTIGPDFARIDV